MSTDALKISHMEEPQTVNSSLNIDQVITIYQDIKDLAASFTVYKIGEVLLLMPWLFENFAASLATSVTFCTFCQAFVVTMDNKYLCGYGVTIIKIMSMWICDICHYKLRSTVSFINMNSGPQWGIFLWAQVHDDVYFCELRSTMTYIFFRRGDKRVVSADPSAGWSDRKHAVVSG